MTKVIEGKMLHPLWMFFLALLISAGFSSSIKAQDSEGWAAGEIALEYVKGSCRTFAGVPDTVDYDVILKFYRDDIGATANPFPQQLPVFIFSPDNGIPISAAQLHVVELIPNSTRGVTQYCLNGNPVATEGAWYRSELSVEIAADQQGDWFFAFVGRYGGNYRSSEDRNIVLGQNFYNETRFSLECGDVSGTVYDPVTQTYVPTTRFNPAPRLTPTDYVFEDPVASFCVGKEYEWNIKALKGNDIDDVEFDIAPIWDFKNLPVTYLVSEGYSISNPFPVPTVIDDSDLENRGILRFTAEREFAGPVPFYVYNYRDIWKIQDGSANNVLVRSKDLTLVSQREYRFIFDDDCNSRLPDFVGGVYREANPGLGDLTFFETFNTSEGAYEYDCATNEFFFELTEPVLIESLGLIGVPYENQDQGFRFASLPVDTISIGDTLPSSSFLDDIPIRSVTNVNVVNVDETDLLRVTLDRRIGPGKYMLYMKKGDDLNTLVNRCETTLPENIALAKIYLNDEFEYNHREDQYTYCYPSAKPPEVRLSVQNPDYVGWRYYGGQRFFPPGSPGNSKADDTVFHDTTYLGPRRFTVDRPADSNWYNSKINIGAGWWEVGAGYDFSTFDPQTGEIIEERICFGWDEFYVDTVTVDSLAIPDFDLCPNEALPVIDLSAYSSEILLNSFRWGKWDGESYKDFYSQFTDPKFPPPNNQPDSSGKDYVDVSTKNYVFDTRGAFTGVGDTNFFRAYFRMRGKYLRNRTCPVQVEFKVLKQLVLGEITPRDSAICENEQYPIYNTNADDYFKEDQYSFQWYFNGNPIQGDTLDSTMVTQTGFYKFEVLKETDSATCENVDSIYIEIADYMDSVAAACSEVTFNNGQIEQIFSWWQVPIATSYEVREVYSEVGLNGPNPNVGPWEKASDPDGDGVKHLTRGPQVALQIRAVNDSVAETAVCRYSDTSFAEPCEAIVKPTNVFTPNGDGINDFLKFDLVEIYPGSTLQIFNRWGKLIYEDTDYFNDWDGEDYQEGTYFYVLQINDPEEMQDLLKGTFTIIRD